MRHFVILVDGTQRTLAYEHYERRLDGDAWYHEFWTSATDRERWADTDVDRVDELLAGERGAEDVMLRRPLWPALGTAAPEAVHGHELPARWRALTPGEMSSLAQRVGVTTTSLTGAERTASNIRDLILEEIDWVEPVVAAAGGTSRWAAFSDDELARIAARLGDSGDQQDAALAAEIGSELELRRREP